MKPRPSALRPGSARTVSTSSTTATVAKLAGEHGLAPIAASTHPFARWSTQEPTERERYQAIARDLAGVGRRLVICGMHVHVGIEDDELRIDLMNQARYFLPHLLVLSTSSPFAEGEDTGLKCYRLAAYQELPRTGLPGRFESWEEYRQTVDLLVRNGIIEDASKIWWDLRPSAKLPDARDAHHRRVHPARGRRVRGGACTSASCACSTASAAPTRPGAPIRCSCCRRTAGGRSATASTARCSTSARASWCHSATSSTSCWCCCAKTPRRSAACAEIEHAAHHRRSAAPAPTGRWPASSGWWRRAPRREDALKGVVDHLIPETVGGRAAP